MAHCPGKRGCPPIDTPEADRLLEALLFQWIYPKGWVIAVGALTAYAMVGGNVLWETSAIAAVNAGTCFASVAIWAAFGSAIDRLLGKPNCRRFGRAIRA